MNARAWPIAWFLGLPALAGAQDARPALLLGDAQTGPLPTGAADLRLTLAVDSLEPLTIVAASYDTDVDVAVEDERGARVAFDRDSALETNAAARWTPEVAAAYVIRVLVPVPAAGTVAVQVLRGAPAVDPAEPAFAARAYWEIARQQALQRSDMARAEIALEHLRELAAPEPWDENAFLERERRVAEILAATADADIALKSRDLRAARDKLAAAFDALKTLAGEPGGAETELIERMCAVATECAPPPLRIELAEQGLALALRYSFEADPDLPQRLRLRLARARMDAGELASARELTEQALRVRQVTLHVRHRWVAWATNDLGRAAAMQRDFQVARSMFERVVSQAAHVEVAEPGLIAAARNNLTAVLADSGDLAAARALEEELLASLRARFGNEHPSVLQLMSNHATTLRRQGELERAIELHREVVAAATMQLQPSDARLLLDRANLAVELHLAGHVDDARALLVDVLALQEETGAAADPALLRNRVTLGAFAGVAGDAAEGARIAGEAVAELAAQVPADDPMLAWARRTQCLLYRRAGETEPALAALAPLIAGVDALLARAAVLSVREAQIAAARVAPDVGLLLAMHPLATAEMRARMFDTIETRRIVANGARSSRRAADDDIEVAALRTAALQSRERASRYLAALSGGAGARPSVEHVAAAVRAHDAADGELQRALARRGLALVRADSAQLAGALEPDQVAVSFIETTRPELSVSDSTSAGSASCAALVVRPGAAPELIELGDSEAIAGAVERWRSALARSVEDERAERAGVGGTTPAAASTAARSPRDEPAAALREEWAASRALRELVFDPLAAHAGGARTWFVCSDGPLHGVALDALVLDEDSDGSPALVGDRLRIVNEVSFERWLTPVDPPRGAAELVAVGGIDYTAEAVAAPHSNEFATPRLRSGANAPAYPALPATAGEARAVAKLFAAAFDRPAHVLDGAGATKEALAASAVRARVLHVATHGYFAESGATDARAALVAGAAPMSLCGLALAGAARGMDAVGRAPGILTAEELASFDLSRCDLAVLSACKTNVGLRSSGAGMHSLRAALHAAGARSTITCLWRVDDQATATLMREMYARLFADGASRSEALWSAKCALRARGAPTCDWAGWVLTGEPGPLAAAGEAREQRR